MTETKRITIRIPVEQFDALEKLVSEGDFKTISDAIREAIDSFVDVKVTPEHIEKFIIAFPKVDVNGLDALVKEGDSLTIDDAVRNAVKEYVRKKLERE